MSEDSGSQLSRSVLEYGQNTFKVSLLMNGGAAIALLAFIGNIELQNMPAESKDWLNHSLLSYCVGVLFCGLSVVFAFFGYLSDTILRDFNFDFRKHRFVAIGKRIYFPGLIRIAKYGNILMSIFLLLSLLSFALGSYNSYRGIAIYLAQP